MGRCKRKVRVMEEKNECLKMEFGNRFVRTYHTSGSRREEKA